MNIVRTMLITGASSGIGRHCALYFARQGHHVIGTGRNMEALQQLKEEAGELKLDVLRLDVMDQGSIDAAVTEIEKLSDGKGIDVLVNNSGIAIAGALADLPVEQIRKQFETNVVGLMAVTRAFLPQLLSHEDSRLINISSLSGLWTRPMMGAYAGSKHALEAMSDALRWELRPMGCKVVLVEPGPVQSDIPNRTAAELKAIDIEGSPFKHLYDKVDSILKTFDRVAVSPDYVAKAIEKGIDLPVPKARYAVRWYMMIAIHIYRHLPQSLIDWLICKVAGLTPDRVRWKAKDGSNAG